MDSFFFNNFICFRAMYGYMSCIIFRNKNTRSIQYNLYLFSRYISILLTITYIYIYICVYLYYITKLFWDIYNPFPINDFLIKLLLKELKMNPFISYLSK